MNPSLPQSKISKPLFAYIANGIPLHSEIELPELLQGPEYSDVLIQFGVVPNSIKNPKYIGVKAQAGANEFLLHLDGIAKYHLYKKVEKYFITIQVYEGVPLGEVRIFLLASVLGALTHMYGFLPIHASGIVINREGILFAGKSGLGKSTLCAALYQKGYQFLTDNIAAISLNEKGELIVFPSYSQVRLWEDSISVLDSFDGDLVKMRDAIEKYNVLLKERIQKTAVPLKKIYILNLSQRDGINFYKISGREKADLLLHQTFRVKLLKGLGNQKKYFQLLNKICKEIDVTRIERPINSFNPEELVGELLHDLNVSSL